MDPRLTAPRQNVTDLLHGVAVPDPYRWLEAADSAETTAWSEAQKNYFTEQQQTWRALPYFQRRLAELVAGGAIGAPVWRGERQFYSKRMPGAEHPVLWTVDPDGTERALVDPMALDPNGTTTLDAWQPSKQGNLLAYQISEGGSEESSLYVIDARTGDRVEGPIDRARYSPVAWLPGEAAYYYVRRLAPELVPADEQQYHRRVYLHRVGSDPATDTEILGTGLTITNYYGVTVSMDGRWLAISASEGTAPRNDLYLADLQSSDPAAPTLRKVFGDVDAQADFSFGRDGKLYVGTDWNAPMGRLCVADPEHPEPANWVDLIPESDDAVLERTITLDGPELAEPLLAVVRTLHTVSQLSLHRLADGALIETVQLPGAGSIAATSERPEGGPEFWLSYTDHVHQASIYKFDSRDRSLTQWALPPGAVQPPDVHSQQVVYKSKDGTDVRMFIISAAARPDRPRPAILYGYGGFGVSLDPAFSVGALAWVEAGGVYAIANLRGGGEEGEHWHRDGMLGNKQNVFDDFIAAAEYLIAEGWTTAEQLGIEGGSNGGLLVGAALTQRPDLYAAVVCSAPLLDMVRYEQHGLGATWNVEYGTAADPEQFGWLHAYSPYHRVTADTSYPAVLFTVFDGDSRVDPLHARKMAAALQWATTSAKPVVVRAEGQVGHGARALSRGIALLADELAFTACHTGLETTMPQS